MEIKDSLWYLLIAYVAYKIIWPILFAKPEPIPETSGNVHKITSAAEFDALVQSHKHTVVDFYADWCPPCRAIAPVFSKLADEHSSKGGLAFAKVNVEHVKDIASRYTVTAMPTFVFFTGGASGVQLDDGLKIRGSMVLNTSGLVDRVRGANKVALETVVKAMAEKCNTA